MAAVTAAHVRAIAEAAHRTGVSKKTIRRRIAEGRLTGSRFGVGGSSVVIHGAQPAVKGERRH